MTKFQEKLVKRMQLLRWNIFLLVLCSATLFAQPGNTGYAFLKLGVSGRGAAMGEALSATAIGAESGFYNPSGLAVFTNDAGHRSQVLLTHKEWIQDTRIQFLGTRIVLGDADAMGLSLTNATVSDIQVRTRPGPAEGTFTARYLSVSLSYARALSDILTVGVSGKYLHEKLFVDESTGFAADIGVHVRAPVEGLDFGLLAANLGSTNNLRNVSTTLPAVVRFGASYVVEFPEIRAALTVAPEIQHYVHSSETSEAVGLELLYEEQVAGRAGYQFGSETRGFSAGIGLRYTVLGLDYGYAPIALDLGNAHTITVSVFL